MKFAISKEWIMNNVDKEDGVEVGTGTPPAHRVILNDLDPSHPARNAPLAAIKANYRWRGKGPFRAVRPAFAIAENTFNQLSTQVWTDHWEWTAEWNPA